MMWLGVEVWGNPAWYQAVCNGIQHQGKIIIQNEGIIENAEIGVLLGARDPDLPGNFIAGLNGGIIQVPYGGDYEVFDAKFINNKYGIRFRPYQNFTYNVFNCNPVRPTGNASYLKNCYFDVNTGYLGGLWYKSHVHLFDVDGINFYGCTFEYNQYANPSGHGINAYSSGFRVEDICTGPSSPCPVEEQVRSTFTNFKKGVNSSSSGIYTTYVKNADFNNNTYGVKLSNVNNAAVILNNFNIGKNVADEEECETEGQQASGYGIDMTGCTGFAIEENHFTPGSTGGNFTGIRIAETQATDEVYKNYFDGLSYGNYAVGKNWGYDIWQGLAYFCNENTGNWRDVEVAPGNPSGIQAEIGSTEMTAGNTFTSNADNNFNNLGNHEIGYFYYTGNPPEYPEVVYHVAREPVSIQNECLSHYGGGGSGVGSGRGMVLSPEEKQQAEQEFATNLTDYNNVKALYDNLKDGGNTDATLADVETAWPDDMWELRAELLGKSPHLSMGVLKAAANKTEVLPESIIFEIMAANPDELKKEELIKYLEDKENPLPDYMIDILQQVATGTTYKTVLHRQMAHYNQVKTRAAHDIIRSILNNEVTDYTELRNWLDNIGRKRADEQIIASYMQEGNYTDAMSLVNMMPALYSYDDNELTEHNYYTEMLNLQINIEQEERSIFDLTSTEVNNLVLIAENSTGTAGTQAKGILEFAYGHHFCNCIDADTNGYKSSGNINFDAFNKVFGPDVEVKPNPANEWTSFNFTLPDDETEGIIKISDVTGKIIEIFTVKGKQGQQIWDTRKIKPGVYLYTFTVNGISKSGKIVISK